MSFISNQYVRSLRIDRSDSFNDTIYPFNIPALKLLNQLDFDPNVTFLIGENGSGKSTLLEAMAVSLGLNAEGGSNHLRFHTKKTHSVLHNHVKIVRGVKRPRDNYFLRAESFYNVASEIERIEEEDIFGSGPGVKFHEFSHGESFFELIFGRLNGNGLYLLDEPEAALSPTRQLSFVSRIHDLCKLNSQIIIATHSPIILSYPHSTIYQLSNEGIQKITYEKTEHFQITKNFLNNHQIMLNELLKP